MKMCKFCVFKKDGDAPSIKEELISMDVSVQIGGKIENDPNVDGKCFNLNVKAEKILDAEVGIWHNKNNYTLVCGIYDGIDETMKRIKINYCPICGRKLNAKEDFVNE